MRKDLGEPWYWPLEPRGSSEAVKAFGRATSRSFPERGPQKKKARSGGGTPGRGTAEGYAPPLDFRDVVLDGLEIVLEEHFADLSPIDQQPLAYQLLDRIVGMFEMREVQPSPAEQTFLRRAIELYAVGAFYEACAEGYRAVTAGQSEFFDGGIVKPKQGESMRRALWSATTLLLSVPRAGDVLEAARNLQLEGTGQRIFTQGKRYDVLGSLNEAWVVDDTGTDNLLDGDYLMNFRIHRRTSSES